MHTAAGFGALADFGAFPNVGQVFQHQRSAWFDSRNDLLTEDVIGGAAKACLFPTYPFQVALRGSRALLLQRPLQMKQSALDGFPRPLAQKLVVTRYQEYS
jgi:hypothetical protein